MRRCGLQDGSAAGAGDTILTRRHDRALRIGRTQWVTNGDRWTIAAVRADGGLDVHHRISRRALTLPGAYVAAHVALGYAATFDAAPRVWADTSHSVLTGSETREQLYIAATRGRHANHIHVVLTAGSDSPEVDDSDGHQRLAAVDLLRGVITRMGQIARPSLLVTSQVRHVVSPMPLPAMASYRSPGTPKTTESLPAPTVPV